MTDAQKEIFTNIGATDEEVQYYYFSEDEKLFTPIKDENGNVIKTGEQI